MSDSLFTKIGANEMDYPDIPGYKIEEVIGKGGMGVVYRARHLALDRVVALKVLHPAFASDEAFVRSFAQEAKIIARLTHPNIVSVYDFGCHEGTYYLSMQYVKGRTVREIMAERKLTPAEVSTIVLQIAEALDFAHRQEVIHRDVKPGNFMLTADGRAMIMDFGVAYGTYSAGNTNVWVAAGSPAYMSPEQCAGRGASPRSDQYSLAVAVYEMVSGRLPFSGDDPMTVMRQQVHETPPPLRLGRTDISPRTEAAVTRAMSKMPEMRFQTVSAFAHELDAAIREVPALESRAGVPVPAGLPAGGLGAGPRGPVSLVDGTPVVAPARGTLPHGYVFADPGGRGGKPSNAALIWATAVAVFAVLAGLVYFVFIRPAGQAAPKPSRSTSGALSTGTTAPRSPTNP